MTSGDSSNTETPRLPANRRRTIDTEASTARATVIVLDTLATKTLVFTAWISAGFDRNWRYQRSVKPDNGKDTTTPGTLRGKVILQKIVHRLAPRSLAASSKERSRFSSVTKMGRATNGTQT